MALRTTVRSSLCVTAHSFPGTCHVISNQSVYLATSNSAAMCRMNGYSVRLPHFASRRYTLGPSASWSRSRPYRPARRVRALFAGLLSAPPGPAAADANASPNSPALSPWSSSPGYTTPARSGSGTSANAIAIVKNVQTYRPSWKTGPQAQRFPYTSSCGSDWNHTSTRMSKTSDATTAARRLNASAAYASVFCVALLASGKKQRCFFIRNPHRKYGMCTVDRCRERKRPTVVYPTSTPRTT